jgi:FkbM family methyltransferase
VEDTFQAVARNILLSVPRSLSGYNVDLSILPVAQTGTDGGNPWLTLNNGRIFYDHPPTAKDVLTYILLKDQLPTVLNGDTYVIAVHATRRYINGANDLPTDTRIAVDAGAYIGYKAIAFADAIGPTGKVLAVEMMPENYRLLEENVNSNNLNEQVALEQCALSDRTGTVRARQKRRQQATIAVADELDDRFRETAQVPTDTLENVLSRNLGNEIVDFLNVQVNGAELAVLEGLGHWWQRIRVIHVTTPYSVDGEPIREGVTDLLAANGLNVTKMGASSVRAEQRLS